MTRGDLRDGERVDRDRLGDVDGDWAFRRSYSAIRSGQSQFSSGSLHNQHQYREAHRRRTARADHVFSDDGYPSHLM